MIAFSRSSCVRLIPLFVVIYYLRKLLATIVKSSWPRLECEGILNNRVRSAAQFLTAFIQLSSSSPSLLLFPPAFSNVFTMLALCFVSFQLRPQYDVLAQQPLEDFGQVLRCRIYASEAYLQDESQHVVHTVQNEVLSSSKRWIFTSVHLRHCTSSNTPKQIHNVLTDPNYLLVTLPSSS